MSSPFEGPPKSEQEPTGDLVSFAEGLFFRENEELTALRKELEANYTVDGVIKYQEAADPIIEGQGNDTFERAQLGFTLMRALIEKNAGNIGNYLDTLNDAADSANNLGMIDLLNWLEAEIDRHS